MRKMDHQRASRFSWDSDRPLFPWESWTRALMMLAFLFSLTACSYIQTAAQYVRDAVSQNVPEEGTQEPTVKSQKQAHIPRHVVLYATPRHLMVKPRTDSVWLWDRPGGYSARAVRIKKVPSGTPGTVVDLEPERSSEAYWAKLPLKEFAPEPIRWIKVATLLGAGWVRTEFVFPR